MNKKALILSIALFGLISTFNAQILGKDGKGFVEIDLADKHSIYDLINIDPTFEMVDYMVSLVHKNSDSVYQWRKGTFPEESLIDLIKEHCGKGETLLYIEKISYKEEEEIKTLPFVKYKIVK